jgi:hypothetical protein
MRSFILSLFLFCVCGVAAADDGWTLVAGDAGGVAKYYVKNGSCYVAAYTNDHVDFVRCIEKGVIAPSVTLQTIEVALPSCRKEIGILVTREFNGTIVARNSVVFGGGNIASAEFETLCAIAKGMGRL